jgi:hypothetical protein
MRRDGPDVSRILGVCKSAIVLASASQHTCETVAAFLCKRKDIRDNVSSRFWDMQCVCTGNSKDCPPEGFETTGTSCGGTIASVFDDRHV